MITYCLTVKIIYDYLLIHCQHELISIAEVMPDKCEDKTGLMKCRLIVTARLCGYRMYSKICCNSCRSYYNDA